MSRAKIGFLLLSALLLARPSGAVDPALADALLNADSGTRSGAYERMDALGDPEKANLAGYLADHLEDAEAGERAAIALCRLGDIGVPYLDQHARTSFAGAEYAVMGLLMGRGKGPEVAAAILRNGDDAAVRRVLNVIASSGVMPPAVAAQVKEVSQDRRFASEAKAAQEAVEKRAKEQKQTPVGDDKTAGQLKAALSATDPEQRRSTVRSMVGGALDGDTAHLLSQTAANSSEDPDVRFYSALALLKDQWGSAGGDTMNTLLEVAPKAHGEDVIPKLIAALQSTGDAGKQAMVEALDSGKIDRATYDQILSLMAAGTGTGQPAGSASPTPSPWTPDGSHFKTRQPAADAFGKNP